MEKTEWSRAEIAKIARGLSKAQQASLTTARDRHGHSPSSPFYSLRATGGWRTTNILWERGLTDEDTQLSLLGHAVRDYLLALPSPPSSKEGV
jgi:hypothetical protein